MAYALYIGFHPKTAIADMQNAVVKQNIDNIVRKSPEPTWDEFIAAQLEARDEQIAAKAQADAAAAEAARKAEMERLAAYAPPAPTAQPSGDCNSWMVAAGISDMANAYTLIMRESGCNPNAVNRSSGACGMGQQLPCGKWPHVWNEPVGALVDMQNYVYGRYGTWANALAHSYSHNWY